MNWHNIQTVWPHVLEIFILAVAIYYTSQFLRGSRGWPIVVGFIVSLAVMWAAAAFLHLTVLQFLLEKFFGYAIVAIFIIFQPELRRLFAQLGNLPFFASAHEQRESIEVIVQTCERLSEVKIGALIAIEQTIQLHEVVESGVPVDCEATPEMLETIFFPNNAIHDGGVIIKGDRIAYAACIFPLTTRQDLNKSLGTRHRAAIGLSEETDAVVIVVSEENGMISHAYKSQLVRGVTIEELRAFLTSVIVQPAKTRSIVEWSRRHFGQRNKSGPPVITRHTPRPAGKH